MPGVIDILQSQVRQRGRGESSPLLLLQTLEVRHGARISHLPISQRLAQAWVTLTGEPFRPHQSLALSALRRSEPFALIGGGPAARQTMHLLLHEILHDEPQARALLLVPDDATANAHLADITRFNRVVQSPLPAAIVSADKTAREAVVARLLLATPQALHTRLLRYHDRAWQHFWSHARLLLIADAHRYSGVAAAHLAALVMRSARLAPAEMPPLLAATLATVDGAEGTLRELSGQSWRLITVDDAPRPVTTLAVWRATTDRLRETVALALAFQREGYTAHISCPQSEAALLLLLLGSDNPEISVGPIARTAQVQIYAGCPESLATLHQVVDSGPQLTLLVLGDLPLERTLARVLPGGDTALTLVDDAAPAWIPPPANAYIAAQHMLCAASERPLTQAEVQSWHAEAIIARLEQQQQLVRLPDAEAVWQPLPAVGDPYADCDLSAAGSPVAYLRDERGALIATLDPAAYDRWGFIGATLPPLRSSYRVIQRDDDTVMLMLRAEQHGRRTFPLRQCNVSVRDERERRTLRGCSIGWGRVLIEEEVYGYREAQTGSAAVERALKPPLHSRWSAPAMWIELPRATREGLSVTGASGQQLGWSLVAALPLRAICALTDVVPAYDPDQRRLYLVDAQPGGNGLAAWIFEHLETLLPLAYDIALDCRNDNLMEPIAQADKDWLLALLGGTVTLPTTQPTVRPVMPLPSTESITQMGEVRPLRPAPAAPAPEPAPRSLPPTPRPAPIEPALTRNAAVPETPRPAPREPVSGSGTLPPESPRLPQMEPAARNAPTRAEPPAPTPTRNAATFEPPRPPTSPPASPPLDDEQMALPLPPIAPRPQPVERDPAPTPPPPAQELRQNERRRGRGRESGDREASDKRQKTERQAAKVQRPTASDREAKRAANQPTDEHETGRAANDERRPTTGKPADERETGRAATDERRPTTGKPANAQPQRPNDVRTPMEQAPDPAVMLARLRRMREQREASARPEAAAPRRNANRLPVEPRFAPGDRIFCLPYGYGEVRASRLEEDREMLKVAFPDYGELSIDPAVSMVRRLEAPADAEGADDVPF